MATSVAPHPAPIAPKSAARTQDGRSSVLLVSVLTLFAFAIHGYHPYADDGGLYMAGVKRLLYPGLYPFRTSFVLEPMRFSLFAPFVAGIVRLVPLPDRVAFPYVVLGLHLASLWMTLFAAWVLSSRCGNNREARIGAVTLLACWLGLPVAGTALMLMDPYLTARSISTPCMILALAGAIGWTDRTHHRSRRGAGLGLMIGSLLLAMLMHPLMAAYALGGTLLLVVLRNPDRLRRAAGALALCMTALASAWLVQHASPAESAAYHRIALTRTYWFISRWKMYEIFGLAAPLLILFPYAAARSASSAFPSSQPSPASALAQMALAAGSTAVLAALLFARSSSQSHLIARMQPLRAFQIVYLVLVLFLGAKLGELLLKGSRWRWGLAVILLGAPMLAAALLSYRSSPHLQLPWMPARNPWIRAFEWIRRNSPADALFALDADYINAPEEDAQSFRAIAERSALADFSKDGGEASIAPLLTPQWTIDQKAQTALSASLTTDGQRIAALGPLGVSWIVLSAPAKTGLHCPFREQAVLVCSLPGPQSPSAR